MFEQLGAVLGGVSAERERTRLAFPTLSLSTGHFCMKSRSAPARTAAAGAGRDSATARALGLKLIIKDRQRSGIDAAKAERVY